LIVALAEPRISFLSIGVEVQAFSGFVRRFEPPVTRSNDVSDATHAVFPIVADTSYEKGALDGKAAAGEKMIRLTKLNNQQFVVNSDLIKFVEESPDTLVTLVSGEKIVVQEKAAEVLARVIEFRRWVLEGLSLTWDPAAAHIVSRPPGPGEPGTEK